ncbi:MAG: hypothetical protein IBJ16_02440 [Chitinophagaceae bacterium]|nr:hypothetical protein [Chitinophagaceae bacterium]
MKYISWLLIAGITVLSCSKPIEVPPSNFPVVVKKIKEIRNGTNDFRAYTFHANGSLQTYTAQFTSRPDGAITQYSLSFQYDQKRLLKMQAANGYSLYYYKDGKPHIIQSYNQLNNLFATSFLTINEKNQVTEIVEQFKVPLSNELAETKTLFFYNTQDNLIRKEYYSRQRLNDPFEFHYKQLYESYDRKVAVPEEISTDYFLPGFVFMKNNPIKIITVDKQGVAGRVDRFEYTYDSDGYVLTKKHFVENMPNPVIPITFSYTYW